MSGLSRFLRKEGVIGIAAGFVLGGALGKLLENFVVGVVDPLVSNLFNTTVYVNKSSVIGEGVDVTIVNWGPSVVLLVNVLVVLLVIWVFAAWLGYYEKKPKKDKKDKKKK